MVSSIEADDLAKRSTLDTVRVVDVDDPNDYVLINRDAFDPAVHKLLSDEVDPVLLDLVASYEAADSSRQAESVRRLVPKHTRVLSESEIEGYDLYAIREFGKRFGIAVKSRQGLLDELRAAGRIVGDDVDVVVDSD